MKINDFLNRLTMGRALILGLAIAVFYYYFVFDDGMAQLAAISSAQTRIQELQAQMTADQEKLNNAAVYKKTVAEVGTTINKLLSMIPEKFAMSDLMRIVSNEAKVAGSSLNSIEPKGAIISPAGEQFEEFSVTVTMAGSFLQHMVFLSNLTKINQILIVKNFKFTHTEDGKGDEAPTVTFAADLIAYRYRGGDVSPSGSGGTPGTGQ